MSKLTVSINEAVVRRAKQYARRHGKSLSKVIEQYLAYVTKDELPPADITPTSPSRQIHSLRL